MIAKVIADALFNQNTDMYKPMSRFDGFTETCTCGPFTIGPAKVSFEVTPDQIG
jgi:hypothetical protein